jgi:ABC-type dipeptide/oligopeptide/nickel transport system permease subunit
MATIASRGLAIGAERWELPAQKPWIVRVSRPWLSNPLGLIGLVIVAAFAGLGFVVYMGHSHELNLYFFSVTYGFDYTVTPEDPRLFDAQNRYASPSAANPFGTNDLGQDMFSRVIKGTELSLQFSVIALLLGFIPGTFLGILSGYAGRWVDYLIQRSGETWASLPQLPILLTLIAAIGPGLTAVYVIVAIGAIFGGSRLMRAVSLLEKHKDYILAARATGASEGRILFRYIIPNVMPYILVGASSVFAVAIVAEATLSFLGLGAEQGTPGWGIDLSKGLEEGSTYPHLVIFPGLAISIVVLGFNLLGDTLRDILDPRLRGTR